MRAAALARAGKTRHAIARKKLLAPVRRVVGYHDTNPARGLGHRQGHKRRRTAEDNAAGRVDEEEEDEESETGGTGTKAWSLSAMCAATWSRTWQPWQATVSGKDLRRGRQSARLVTVACILDWGARLVEQVAAAARESSEWPRAMWAQYGTDETEQWRSGGRGKEQGGSCSGNVLSHVQVHRLVVGSGASGQVQRQVVLPPTLLQRTRGATLFASTTRVLSTFALGGASLKEYLQELLGAVDFVLLTVITDAASANSILYRGLAGVVQDAGAAAASGRAGSTSLTGLGSSSSIDAVTRPGPLAATFKHNCLVHQLMRAVGAGVASGPVRSPLYSLTRILQRSRRRDALAEVVEGVVAANLQFVLAPPPGRRAFRGLLENLLAAPDSGKGRLQIVQLLQVLNGFPGSGSLQHFCSGPDCCALGKRDAITKVARGIVLAFYSAAVPVYNPARWTKQFPAVRWVGGQMLLGSILPRLWDALFPGQPDEKKALNDLLTVVAEEDPEKPAWHVANATRIARASAFLHNERSRVLILLELFVAAQAEPLLAVLMDQKGGPSALQAVYAAYLRHQSAIASGMERGGALDEAVRAFNSPAASLREVQATVQEGLLRHAGEVFLRFAPAFSTYPAQWFIGPEPQRVQSFLDTPECCLETGLCRPLLRWCESLPSGCKHVRDPFVANAFGCWAHSVSLSGHS